MAVEVVLYWLTAAAALVGVALNIHRHVACFYIWFVTNSVWVIADLRHGIFPQAALQAVYVALSIYGIVKWTSGRMPTSRARSRHGE